jgi:hypothetical protein
MGETQFIESQEPLNGQPQFGHESADFALPSQEDFPPSENAESDQREDSEPVPLASERRGWIDEWHLGALVRTYYLNDQRIQWSGLEETFGAEGVIAPQLKRQCGEGGVAVEGEFYINQPFDRNIFVNSEERRSYLGNYEMDPFEISQLLIRYDCRKFEAAMGKFVTPFGRTYFPLMSNARLDAPFIRTEAIHWRETGILLGYKPGAFGGQVGLVNGSEDCDTNSAKGIVARVGWDTPDWAFGGSIKFQDGVGSETQKMFNNHAGLDAMVCLGPFMVSGEVIYDEYGFHRPGFDPNDITWGRSIYYRDLSLPDGSPLTGIGYYCDLEYRQDRWIVSLNYGEYYPKEIGDPQHDIINRRGIAKLAYNFTEMLSMYGATIIENGSYVAQDDRLRRIYAVLTGVQCTF